MKKEQIKRKFNKIFFSILFCWFVISTSVCFGYILDWYLDGQQIKREIKDLQSDVIVQEIKDNDNTIIVNEDIELKKNDPYWEFIEMNMIHVDFNELKKINSDVKGWIQVMGTNINYPFVQTTNNDYYLNHTFNKESNNAGWVFMDYENNIETLDKNTIIYAHGRYDNTMFGTLKNGLTNGWLEQHGNHVIKLSTEHENTLWQVFSAYRIPTTSDYLEINFVSDDNFMNFSNMLINRSVYNFNTEVYPNDKILTLSTCYNNKEKIVFHAKLIKYEKRSIGD